jgi:hypothetical protein
VNEMLLLGAGASVEAGVPDAHRMTHAIVKRIRKGQERHYSAHTQTPTPQRPDHLPARCASQSCRVR